LPEPQPTGKKVFSDFDTPIKFGIIFFTLLVDLVLLKKQGFVISPVDSLNPLEWGFILSFPLGLGALFYHWRGIPQFSFPLVTLMHMILYPPVILTLSYLVTTFNMPLRDQTLFWLDQQLGFRVIDFMNRVSFLPSLKVFLDIVYDSLGWQTLFAVFFLGWQEKLLLRGFLLQWMLTTWMTLLMASVYPATGPWVTNGYPPSSSQTRYAQQFHALRSGEKKDIPLKTPVGLVTFPSFHTANAVILAAAFFSFPRLFFFFGFLNLLVVVSTMSTGWHYLSDVLVGIAMALFAIFVTRKLGYLPAAQIKK
jgi:membrane-associated phospholipid phosphatase